MASCGLCNSFGRTKIQYNRVLAREHAETHFLQLKIIDDGITTDQIFEKCFPDFARSKNSGRKDLNALCRGLFPKKSFTNSSMRIICERCNEETQQIGRGGYLKPNALIEHACIHLKLNAYECLHCVQEFRSRGSLFNHMIVNHQFRTLIGNYRSKVDDHVGEISAMITACFGDAKKTKRSDGITTVRSADTAKVRGCTKGSHLAVQRQLFCHRLIRKTSDRNGTVQCRVCSKGIRATNGKNVLCQSIRDHAYCHLPTPLFRCRHCANASFGLQSMRKHLRATHALPCLKQNFECLADQYHTDILAMLNKCYGDECDSKEIEHRDLSESMICKKSAQSNLSVRRRLLCHRLIRNCVSAERLVQCRLCSKQMVAKAKGGNSFESERVMHHAFMHLGKKLYQCNKCSDSFVTRIAALRHAKQPHASSSGGTYYNSVADQHHDDIVRVLRQCYGVEGDQEKNDSREAPTSIKPATNESESFVPSKLTIQRQTLCQQLAREHNDCKNNRLHCRLCNKRIIVKRPSGVCSAHAMYHALSHLDKPIHRCKICSETFVTRSNVGYHLRTKHALPLANNFDCLDDQFHEEIAGILRKCYNKETTAEAKPFKRRSMTESKIRGNMNGSSKQAVERQLFCHRLIRIFVKTDGKVECRVCKKRIAAAKGERYQANFAMMHATVHLNKPIYRCAVCSEKRPYFGLINYHLKKAHGLSSTNNYESHADEYHSEILAQLRECYGEL